MTLAATDNTYFAPILPDFSKFFGDVDKKAREGGKRAGKAFSESVGTSLKSAERAADNFADSYKRAQDRAADASGKTRIAQEKLTEVLNDSTSSVSKIRTATERYEKAQRDEARAVNASEKAAKDLERAQEQVAKATSEASDEFRMGQDEVDAYGLALDGAADKSSGFGSKLLGGLKTMGVGALLGVGARAGNAVVDGIRGSFDAGFSRLASVEQAEQMLVGLGHSTNATATILDNAMNSVKGTAYGFGEAASMAATFVGAGIPEGKELERVLTLVGDTAAITGSDLNEMGSIWTKVATGAKLGTEEMNQLMDRGLGILPELQKHYGVTAEEARKMVTDGKVSFEEFSEIMENMVGGSAQAMGDTFSGAAANAKAALGRLGASILAPAFDAAPAIFRAIGGGIDHLNEYLTPLIESWGEKLTPYLENFANNLGPWLETAIDNVAVVIGNVATVVGNWVDSFKDIYEWGTANQEWLVPLIAGLTTLVGTVVAIVKAHQAYVKALMAYRTAVVAARAATIAFSTSLWANPLVWVAAAIVAVIAALALFFTQTEKGKAIWAGFTSLLGTAWDWVVDKFSTGVDWVKEKWAQLSSTITGVWQNYIKPVFDAFSTVVQTVLGAVFAVVVGSAMVAWNVLSAAIQAGWNNIIKPAWNNLQTVLQLLWNNVVQPIFNYIGWAWNNLATLIQAGWNNVIKPAWDNLKAVLQYLWNNVVNPILTFIGNAWNAMSNRVRDGWNNTIKPAWTALQTALRTLWNTYVNPIVQWIGDKWDWVKNQIKKGVDTITGPIFGGLKSALDNLKGFFTSIVNGIRDIWNKLRGHLAKPINFMINTVYNDGILEAWNVIAGILPGLNKGSPLSAIPEYAVGGHVRGPGTGTSDDIFARLSNGEHVWTARESRAIGHDNIYRMREAVAQGRGFTYDGNDKVAVLPKRIDNTAGDLAGAAPGLFPGYAKGGEVRPLWEAQLIAAHKFAKAQHGKPYQWAGPTGPGSSFDCSGFMGSIAAVIQGTNPWQRYWATMSFPSPGAQGFAPGLGPGFSIGIFNGGPYGGHTAGTLGPAGPYGSVNVESGGSPSMVKYGPGAVGADHGSFTMQYHLPIGADGSFVSGGGGGISPEAMKEAISKKLTGAVDKIMDPILSRLPEKPPEWKGIPRGMYDKGRDGLVDKIASGVAGLSDRLGSVFAAVSGMGDLVRDAATGTWDWITTNLFDSGGVWKSGTMGINLSGADEYVFTNKSMRSFELATENLRVAAKEIAVAYRGGDWGYGALADILGREDWALAIVNGAATLGRVHRDLDAWAAATEEQDRMADPEEWATHFGTMAGTSFADQTLGLVGLDGIVGKPLRQSFVDLVNAAVPYANSALKDHDVHGFRFGKLSTGALQPADIIDENGRRKDTRLESVTEATVVTDNVTVETPEVKVDDDDNDGDGTGDRPSTSRGAQNVLVVEGGKVYSAEDLEKLNGKLDNLKVRIDKAEDAQRAGVDATASLMV